MGREGVGRGVGLLVGLGVGAAEEVTKNPRLAVASLSPIGKDAYCTYAVETWSSSIVESPGTRPLTVPVQLPPGTPIATRVDPMGSLEDAFSQTRMTSRRRSRPRRSSLSHPSCTRR